MAKKKTTSKETPVIRIYDTIGDGGVTPIFISRMLNTIGKDATEINVLINSPGGDVFAGFAIYNELKNHPSKINVKVYGWAASAASIVALAGQTNGSLTMEEGALMMIHKASSLTWGNSDDHRKSAEILDTIDGEMVSVYHDKTGLDPEEIKEMMASETWMNAKTASEMGFADNVFEDSAERNNAENKLVAKAKANKPVFEDLVKRYQKAPEQIAACFGGVFSATAKCDEDEDKEEEAKAEGTEEEETDEEDSEEETNEKRKESDNMSEKKTNAQATEPVAASIVEIKALCGDDVKAEFILEQIEAKATSEDVLKAYAKALKTENETLKKEVEEAKALASAARKEMGNEPVTTPDGKTDAAGVDPVAEYNGLIKALVDSGKTPREAHSYLAHTQPEKHRAYIDAVNGR